MGLYSPTLKVPKLTPSPPSLLIFAFGSIFCIVWSNARLIAGSSDLAVAPWLNGRFSRADALITLDHASVQPNVEYDGKYFFG